MRSLETLAGWRATVRASLGELFAPAAPRLLSSRAQQAERSAPSATAPIWRALPWRAIITQATAMWLVTRLIYVVFTYVAVLFVSHGAPAGTPAPSSWASFAPQTFLRAWQHWDANWYIAIAQKGYIGQQPTAFFPLYPALIAALTWVIGAPNREAAALIIANLGALGGCIGVAAFAYNEEGDAETAWRTLRLALAYPLALFLAAPYTEGLFLAFAVATLLSARRGAWRWVAVWAFLAGLTRITAVVLILPILWEYARQQGWLLRATWRAPKQQARMLLSELAQPQRLLDFTLAVAAAPFAIALYFAYVWWLFGQPFLVLNAQREFWNHQTMPVWRSVPLALHIFLALPSLSYIQSHALVDLGPVVIFTILTLVNARRAPFAFTLYMLGLLYLCVSAPLLGNPDTFDSAGRYLVVAAPLFLLLARWSRRRPWLDVLLVSSGFLLQAIFLASYFTGGSMT